LGSAEVTHPFHPFALLARENATSSTGKPFTLRMIRRIRYKYRIHAPPISAGALNVRQLRARYGVSMWVVYYWIERGLIEARRRKPGLPYAITISEETDRTLRHWVANSSHLAPSSPNLIE
jgi:hypothetical protein